MKKKLVWLVVLLVVLGMVVTAVSAADTHHWLLENGSDAYVLCVDGQFTIDVNGDDSIHLTCHAPAIRPEGARDGTTD